MLTPTSDIRACMFTSGEMAWATDGLDDAKRITLSNMLYHISELGRSGQIDTIREIQRTLSSSWQVSYGDDSPQWVVRSTRLLQQIITKLEQAGAGIGVDRVKAQVTGSIPRAATWEPNLNANRRDVLMNPGLAAAELPTRERLIGAQVDSPLDKTPRDRR